MVEHLDKNTLIKIKYM